MMQNHSSGVRKYILILLLNVFILVCMYGVQIVSKKNILLVCNTTSGLTVVIIDEYNTSEVISNASEKDMYNCLGKSLPFYDHSIATIISPRNYQDIQDRYFKTDVQNKEIGLIKGSIYVEESRVVLSKNNGDRIVVHLKSPGSPYDFVHEKMQVGYDHILPRKNPQYDHIAEQALYSMGLVPQFVDLGQILKREL